MRRRSFFMRMARRIPNAKAAQILSPAAQDL